MSAPGRNEPCPCGSGRKYKKCCALKVFPAGYAEPDREAAKRRLHKVARAPRFLDDVRAAWDEFGASHQEVIEGDDSELDYARGMSMDAFVGWLAVQRQIRGGRRIVDHALDAAESRGERTYLEALSRSALRLYEVVGVKAGESLTLRDVLTKGEVTVVERTASRTIRVRSLLAARVMDSGTGGLAMDLGCLPVMLEALPEILKEFEEIRRDVGENQRAFDEAAAVILHDTWLAPTHRPPPELQTTDGEAVLFTTVRFEVSDVARLSEALDGTFERGDEEGRWTWAGESAALGGTMSLGALRLEGERLVLECMSAERGERGRALVEQAAGDSVKHLATTHEHPLQKMAEGGGEPAASGLDPDVEAELIQKFQAEYYQRWLDDSIPALGGKSPRAAVALPEWRPKVVALLDGLEDLYRGSLEAGRPGYDPSRLWSDLGLAAEGGHGEGHLPPPTGGESMAAQVPGLLDTAREVAARLRKRPDFGPGAVYDSATLGADLAFHRFLRAEAVRAMEAGLSPERAVAHADLLGAHLETLTHFEAHLRKTFWVSEALAWMLGQTNLDLTGDAVRPPFACLALVFTDRGTLATAERMLALDPVCELRGAVLRVATVYVTSGEPAEGQPRSLRLAFHFDALDGRWPYLVVRDLLIRPEAPLSDVLESRHPDVEVASLDPMLRSAQLRALVGLALNALLYATGAGDDAQVRRAPPRAPKEKRPPGPAPRPEHTEEVVFYLPGTIDISRIRQLQGVERSATGGELMHRFLVRGHWRRANPAWKDSRPRWIKPYWKGPDLGAIVEHGYRLVP